MIKKIFCLIILFLLFTSSVHAQGSGDLTTCDETRFCQGGELREKNNCAKRCDLEPPGTDTFKCRCICTYFVVGVCKDGQPVTQPWDKIIGTINTPAQIKNIGFGGYGISNFLSNIVSLIYIVAGIVFVFMMITGAFQWIISGGDKDAVAKARSRITNAIVGLVILAVTFLIVGAIGQITGFTLFVGQPTPK